jgi:hypothetical protein
MGMISRLKAGQPFPDVRVIGQSTHHLFVPLFGSPIDIVDLAVRDVGTPLKGVKASFDLTHLGREKVLQNLPRIFNRAHSVS